MKPLCNICGIVTKLGCSWGRITKKEQKIFLEKSTDTKLSSELYGLSRTLVANMVKGVSEGFQKRLQITGVGYRAQLDGKNLVLNMGYSHPVHMTPPADLSIKIENLADEIKKII